MSKLASKLLISDVRKGRKYGQANLEETSTAPGQWAQLVTETEQLRACVLDPGLRLSNAHIVQAMRPEDLSRWRTGLAKAGLPP